MRDNDQSPAAAPRTPRNAAGDAPPPDTGREHVRRKGTTIESAAELIEGYLAPYRGRTLENYTGCLRRWIGWCGNRIDPVRPTRTSIEVRIGDMREDDLADNAIRRYLPAPSDRSWDVFGRSVRQAFDSAVSSIPGTQTAHRPYACCSSFTSLGQGR